MAIPGNDSNIYFEIARGKEGFSYVHKFGHTTNATTTSSPIWSEGGAYTYLTTAKYLKLASTDADDTAGDTGARTVQIYGLDSNYARQNETVTLNGQTGVTTTSQYLRLFRMVVRTAGTSEGNEGIIRAIADQAGSTFTAAGVPTTTSNIQAGIEVGDGQTRMCLYTVPASYTAYLVSIFGSSSNNNEIEIVQVERPFGQAFQYKNTLNIYRNWVQRDFVIPRPISAKTDIQLRAAGSASSADVAGAFDLILVDVNQ
jgi:hypothetical protein